MASAAEPDANRSSISLTTSQPTIRSIRLNEDPVPNEEAVVSESSLSQINTQSIRSTPASSFSIQQTSPEPEAQSVREIELSSISSHGNPGEPSGNYTLQPTLEESSQHQSPSPTLAGEQNQPSNTVQTVNRYRSYATSFPGSLRTVYHYVPKYEITSNTIALLALVINAFFGYKSYRIAREGLLSATPSTIDSNHITYRVFIFLGLMVNVGFIIYRCMAWWLNGGFFRAFRRLRQILGYQQNAFDPVHVRLTHPQVRSSSAGLRSGSQASQTGGRRRIIHGINEQTYEEYDRTRKRSFQPNFDLLKEPFWKRAGLGSLATSHETPAPVRRASIDSALSQIGDAFKGDAPDDLIFPPQSPSHIFRRVLRKTSIFHFGDSDDDIEPPLTALLADPEPEENTKRKVAITSGVVALGLVQAGSALASSIGGGIGPEILVKSESSGMEDKLISMPLSSQDTITTSVER